MSLLKLLRNARFIKQMLVNFKDSDVLKNLVVGSDQEIGGFSSADLDIVTENPGHSGGLSEGPTEASTGASTGASTAASKDPTEDTLGHNSNTLNGFGRFHGNLSLDLPQQRRDVIRSGYAMFRTKELQPSLFGIITECWDWKACSHMMLRVRGDRRKYFINVQADTPLQTDLYQHRLFLKTPGQWETVIVPISSFILTNWGIIQQQVPMNRDQVRTVGLGLTDNQYGPFCLDIDWIKVVSEIHVKALLNGISVGNKALPTPGKRLSIDDFK